MPRRLALSVIPLLLLLIVPALAPTYAQEREKFTNLKVLPQDIAPEQLRQTMNDFTRALGVRCIHCHVGEEGRPFKEGEFALDDKPTKLKAREMLRMVHDLNEKYLAALPNRSDPPLKIECFTCHRGVTQPRPLQDLLGAAYDQGGIDSTLARYRALKTRYYGRAAYDFGEVPLSLVADHAHSAGHPDDAQRLLALNVDEHPASDFARRQYAGGAIAAAFRDQGADSGAAVFRALRATYGDKIVSEDMLNNVGYALLGANHPDAALAAFRLNVAEHPASGNVYDSLGEALMHGGDRKAATAAYTKSLELDPKNDNARHMLDELKKPQPKKKAPDKS